MEVDRGGEGLVGGGYDGGHPSIHPSRHQNRDIITIIIVHEEEENELGLTIVFYNLRQRYNRSNLGIILCTKYTEMDIRPSGGMWGVVATRLMVVV